MKLIKQKPAPSSLRQEIDAAIQGIGNHIKKDPKKAAKVLECWANDAKPSQKSAIKKKAA